VHARLEALVGEEVLEAPAVELVARDGRMLVGAAFDPLGEVAVVARGEPEAQPALVDLLVLQVLPQAEVIAEVMAGDLLGGLAHLVRGLARGARRLVGDEDARLGALLLELEPQRQPGEAAAENRYVVAVGRVPIIAHSALLSHWASQIGSILTAEVNPR